MADLSTEMLVGEVKGLLRMIDADVTHAHFNLAYDNVKELPKALDKMRQIMDRIENKISEHYK